VTTAGEDLLFLSHGHLGAVVRRPAKRAEGKTAKVDSTFETPAFLERTSGYHALVRGCL
jgi:hypothetical protein